MSNNWAYTAVGRLHNMDRWEWAGPHPTYDSLAGNLMSDVRSEFWGGEKRRLIDEGTNLVGFDGKNWFSGNMALPSEALDPQKYENVIHYGHDQVNRPLHFLHGYTSETSSFPEKIPHVSKQDFVALHEKYIIPIWDEPSYRMNSLKRNVMPYESTHPEVNIAEHLPEDAVATLRQAHQEGKPIAIQYNAESKQWSRVSAFDRGMERRTKDAEKRAAEAAEKAAKPSTSVANAAEQTGENVKSWVAKLWEHPAGKLGIIAGTVGLGAVGAYQLFKSKQDKSQQDASIGR